jgi:hypothetical protein
LNVRRQDVGQGAVGEHAPARASRHDRPRRRSGVRIERQCRTGADDRDRRVTGAVAWQDRTFPKATFVYADGKLILIDEDGQLALVRVSPGGMQVVSRVPALERLSWTPPTFAGTTLYARDQRSVAAFDLKKTAAFDRK